MQPKANPNPLAQACDASMRWVAEFSKSAIAVADWSGGVTMRS
jgi:hypothetical protein